MIFSTVVDSDLYALAAVHPSAAHVLTILALLTTSAVFHSARRGSVTLVEHQALVFGSDDQAR